MNHHKKNTDVCRVVVLISGDGSNLQALINAQQQGMLTIEFSAVISNRTEAFGLKRAAYMGIPYQVVDHRDYIDRASFDKALAIAIEKYQPDLIVLAGFMRILTGDFVKTYTGRILNIHPSLLPKYQGLHTHQRVLDAGDDIHGATVHFVTESLDGGPAIIQASVSVVDEDDVDTLATRVQQQEHIIYPIAVEWFATKQLQLKNNIVQLNHETLPRTGYQIDKRS